MHNAERPRTQKAALAEARAIIDSYPLNKSFARKDVMRLALLSGSRLIMAVQRVNPLHPTASRYVRVIHEKGGVEEDWSWPKAIKRAYAKNPGVTREKQLHDKVVAALRRAVQPDLNAFFTSQKYPVCMKCHAAENLSVDHLKPPFHVIAKEFLELHPVQRISLLEVQGHSGFLADTLLEAEWRAFHKVRAVLQILCRSHNSAKGAHI